MEIGRLYDEKKYFICRGGLSKCIFLMIIK